MKTITGILLESRDFASFCNKNNIIFNSKDELINIINKYLIKGISKSNMSSLSSFFQQNPFIIKKIEEKVLFGMEYNDEFSSSKMIQKLNKKIVKSLLQKCNEDWGNKISVFYTC